MQLPSRRALVAPHVCFSRAMIRRRETQQMRGARPGRQRDPHRGWYGQAISNRRALEHKAARS